MTNRALVTKEKQEFQGGVAPVAAAPGATYTPDLSQPVDAYVLTMGAALTMAAPVGGAVAAVGSMFYFVFIQDSGAGRALTWNAAYRNAPSGLGGSATAGQRASFEFRWDGVSLQYTGGSTAFA